MTTPLADKLAHLLATADPSSASQLARGVRARKSDVLRALHDDHRFQHLGHGPSSVWQLAEAAGNQLGTNWEPQYGLSYTRQIVDIVGRLAALEKRIEAVEQATSAGAT
jgi:hypothetical protein